MQNTQGIKTMMLLKKQRYYCDECRSTFIAETSYIRKHSNLSEPLCLEILSHQSVTNILHGTYGSFKQTFSYLPEHLCFDEFKSVKGAEGAMSFDYCDALTHELIDVVEDRCLASLITYFQRFPIQSKHKED